MLDWKESSRYKKSKSKERRKKHEGPKMINSGHKSPYSFHHPPKSQQASHIQSSIN